MNTTPRQLGTLPFVLFDRRARVLRAGSAALTLLPKAHTTILLVAARDILLLTVPLAPFSNARLRVALPNVVEDQLLQDAQHCHIALEPISTPISVSRSNAASVPAAPRMRRLGVIDRDWFRYIHTSFTEAGHLKLRAVPLTCCLPKTEPEPEGETIPWCALAYDLNIKDENPSSIELALAQNAHGEGLTVPADALADALAAVTADAPLTLYQLNTTPDNPAAALPAPLKAHTLSFETLARTALDCRFDLCQFEFATPLWRIPPGVLKRWRMPLILLMATALIAIGGANLHWFLLARQRDALTTQHIETLLSAFPKTTSVLDAPQQMTRQLDMLRIQAGEPAPDDFLSLAQGLAHALDPVQQKAIAQLRYRDRTLEVTFKPAVQLDAAFRQRLNQQLEAHGLSGHFEKEKWMLRSRS